MDLNHGIVMITAAGGDLVEYLMCRLKPGETSGCLRVMSHAHFSLISRRLPAFWYVLDLKRVPKYENLIIDRIHS